MTVLSLSDISYFSVPRHAESLSVNLYSDMQAVATGGLKRLKALAAPPRPPLPIVGKSFDLPRPPGAF